MKTAIKIGLMLAIFGIISCAQKGDVSQNIKQAFHQKFPEAKNVSWDKENSNEWEAEFKMNGKEYSANFNNAGKWMETESEIESSDVPTKVSQAMANTYSNAKIKEAFKIEREDGIFYEYEFKLDGKTQEVLLNSNGTIIKKQDAEDEQKNEEYDQEDDD